MIYLSAKTVPFSKTMPFSGRAGLKLMTALCLCAAFFSCEVPAYENVKDSVKKSSEKKKSDPAASEVPLASATDREVDINMLLVGDTLPKSCGQGRSGKMFCSDPYPFFMTDARYQHFQQKWKGRKTAKSHLRKLLQVSPNHFVLALHLRQERPLMWLDPNSLRTFRLFPIKPELSQLQHLADQEEHVTFTPLSDDTGEISFPSSVATDLSRYQIVWGKKGFLHFHFQPPQTPFQVLIDPGHGGKDDRGAKRDDIHEAELNLELSKLLAKKLENLGVRTRLIRNDDSHVSLTDRLRLIHRGSNTLFISIHNDAIPVEAIRSRGHCYYTRNDVAKLCQETTESVVDLYEESLSYTKRYLFVLQSITVPSVLSEVLNLSNESHLELLRDKERKEEFFAQWTDRISKAIRESFEKHSRPAVKEKKKEEL